MTLSGNRRRCNRTSITSSNRNDSATSENSVVNAEDAVQIYSRGCSELAPIIPNEADRPLIHPEGETHWLEIPNLGKGRKPASVLACLLKTHHPGVVTCRGKDVVATTWRQYKSFRDTDGRSKADMIQEGFWLRFRYEPDNEDKARHHVGRCCQQLLHNFKYNARINAILDHSRNVEKVQICDKVAGQRYLTRQEYLDQQPGWCLDETWRILVDEWCNSEWIEKSKTNRANRYNPKFKPHKGGSNSITTIRQKLSKKEGREVSQIEAWVYTHRGLNPQDTSSLNTKEATTCLEQYKTKAIELNGPEFDWLHSPVDARALHACSCGRPHGKWATFNGMVADREVLAEMKSHRAASTASKRQCREEKEREQRRMSEDARLAKEYAQTILEWGRGVHSQYNSNLQRFMAENPGMPSSAIPPPLPPPPPPPTYGVLASPNLSLENADTTSSAIRVENPDNILHRIAHGMFGGYFNISGEAGGNYSPDLNDNIGPF